MSDLFNLAAKRALQMSQPSPQKISINIEICQPSEGGLSSIQKVMDIGGEPHKLSYINSDESSLLKAIGAEGEPMKGTNGIPAYGIGASIMGMVEPKLRGTKSSDTSDDQAAMAAYFKRLQGANSINENERKILERVFAENPGFLKRISGDSSKLAPEEEEEKEEVEVEIPNQPVLPSLMA